MELYRLAYMDFLELPTRTRVVPTSFVWFPSFEFHELFTSILFIAYWCLFISK